ncbi:ABC transporter substrate-binding protein [Bacillus sp. S/N-304-OC-R1]|uniref:ABC transporter substrate-binding protein n=1 Tax=Bacillus sp. S/N-304-OC-R1 TaxID=2758034 RepID=UPI001C8E99E8|nr:ABC transporter substrate-binding protein [Bacillus sp. S/N-304-OC-R1]MBY0122747.1 ABC transporter substrate-binding protein [Bacillus sp. S/N-304-OC-R1]
MKSYKKLLSLLIISILTVGLAACGSKESSAGKSESREKRVVKIGYLPITHAVPLFLESEQETFKNFKLELVKFGSWPELMDALNSGRIDGASVLVTLAMKAKEQGIDLKAVALGHRDGNVLVTANDINNVADLKGKNFAIPHKFSTHNILLYQMLKKAGMKYEDVNVVELPPAEMPAALSEGRISGYVVAEPFGAASVAIKKGKVLYQDTDIWKDSIDCALVLRNEFIQKDNNVAQEFVNEYVKAGKVAEKKDDHTLTASSKYMKVDKNVMDLSFKWISYDNLRVNKSSYDELTKSLIEMGLSKNPPSYEEFVDNSLYDKAK